MADREVSIRRTAEKPISDWSSGLDFPLDSFLSISSTNIEWYNHAYQIYHAGYEPLTNLREGWIGANGGLQCEAKAINLIPSGCVIQFIGRRTFSGDIRTIRKATGKGFAYQARLVLDVNDEGLIAEIEEYYSFLHDEGVEVEKYQQVKLENLKM